MKLENGRPEKIDNRVLTEVAVYDMLDQLEIPFERIDHEAAFTMEACAEIDKVLYPAVICKNLFLCNSQKTKFYLLMIKEDKKFITKDISKQIGSARLSFAPEEFMVEYLKTPAGSASIMGLMNDKENRVQLLVDEEVLCAEYVGCHPCINTSSIRIKVKDVFEKFLPAVEHNYIKVVLKNGEI
ncbi:MAG: prolyl-tRNA synthetase associated domain-containing protein [Lachnospiraceae bacterium]|nr:prolyl-tRNA synthetase associated domain-containing protein [Lachnospiraceae bacterium]